MRKAFCVKFKSDGINLPFVFGIGTNFELYNPTIIIIICKNMSSKV